MYVESALPLRQSPRKRHSVALGDASLGHYLAPIRTTPYQSPMNAEGAARALAAEGDIATKRDDPADVRLASPVYWNNLGAELRRAGRYAEARTSLHEARRLAPHDLDIALGLAYLEMECGRFQHAYAMFQIVLRKLPLLVEARIRAARVCYELGLMKRAESLVEGCSCNDLSADASVELAAIVIQLGNVKDGLAMLEEIRDLPQIGVYARICLATALEQTSCLIHARECVASLPPAKGIANPVLREGIQSVRARLALRNGEISLARSLLGFLNTPPAAGTCRSPWMYFLLAEVCYRQSDMEAAQSALDAAHSALVKATDMDRLRVSSAAHTPQRLHKSNQVVGCERRAPQDFQPYVRSQSC